MAKHYYLSKYSFADDFANALRDYYGESGVVIETAADNTIVFKCPSVCDKMVKITLWDYGTLAWIGQGSANMTQFHQMTGYYGQVNSVHLVLSDVFILFDTESVTASGSVLAAKLSNGRYFVSGGGSYRSTWNEDVGVNKCLFTDTMELKPIRVVEPVSSGFKSAGKYLVWPVHVANDLEVELNADGSFAYIPGVMVASSTGRPIVGDNYYLSQSDIGGYNTDRMYRNDQLYVELETE